MLIGYMRVSSDSDRQSTDLQRNALLAAWRHILLNGHYTFQSGGKMIVLDTLLAGLELG